MNILSIFDSETHKEGWKTGFGLSLLIDNHVLFDTGSDGKIVVQNLKYANISPENIDAIVLSHYHWDHTDGLQEVLKYCKLASVYVSSNTASIIPEKLSGLDNRLITSTNPIKISDNIYTSGELNGTYKNEYMPEQALLLKNDDGINEITLIAGCAHYGISKILPDIHNIVKTCFGDNFKLASLLGGFHLSHNKREDILEVAQVMENNGIKKVFPIHCSGAPGKTYLKEYFGKSCFDFNVGDNIKI